MIFTNQSGRRTEAHRKKQSLIGKVRMRFAWLPVALTSHNYEKSVWLQWYVAVLDFHNKVLGERTFTSEQEYNIWKGRNEQS